jgi:hypothetical protein
MKLTTMKLEKAAKLKESAKPNRKQKRFLAAVTVKVAVKRA